jgi:hypothetical protein
VVEALQPGVVVPLQEPSHRRGKLLVVPFQVVLVSLLGQRVLVLVPIHILHMRMIHHHQMSSPCLSGTVTN